LEKRSMPNAQHQLSAFVVQCWALSVCFLALIDRHVLVVLL
jgi:hypothetical protein